MMRYFRNENVKIENSLCEACVRELRSILFVTCDSFMFFNIHNAGKNFFKSCLDYEKIQKINQHVDEKNNMKKKNVVSRTIQVLKPNLKQTKKEVNHIHQTKQSKKPPALKC